MEKRVGIGLKILPSVLEAVDKLAEADSRTRSNAVEWILQNWIREHRPELLAKGNEDPKT